MKKMKFFGFYVAIITLCFGNIIAQDLEQNKEQATEQTVEQPKQDTDVPTSYKGWSALLPDDFDGVEFADTDKIDWQKKHDEVVEQYKIDYYHNRKIERDVYQILDRSEEDGEARSMAYEIENRREIKERGFVERDHFDSDKVEKTAKVSTFSQYYQQCGKQITEKISSSWSTWYGKLFWFTSGFAAICGICSNIQKRLAKKKQQQKRSNSKNSK